jgi:drug/metabolite transporter (DMT)-like permease
MGDRLRIACTTFAKNREVAVPCELLACRRRPIGAGRTTLQDAMLGAFFAILSAASFAATTAAGRRGVVTGTPAQGMVLSNPVGILCFLLIAVLAGEIGQTVEFPATSAAWMAGVGVLQFVVGRYANFRANQSAGVNLTAPVVQLNVVVTLALAVVLIGEPCTILQIIGGLVMFAGAFTTQQQSLPKFAAPGFSPRYAEAYLFALLAALAYGTGPFMARIALQFSAPSSAIGGGLIAYAASTAAVAAMVLLSPALRRNVTSVKWENIRWFVYSGIAVAAAQGFMYAALAVSPIMVVVPLLQLSLVFRLLFSAWVNPHHEVFGIKVILGTVISMVGACAVAIDTDLILAALRVPETLAQVLRLPVR